MHAEEFFRQAFVYLAAAVVSRAGRQAARAGLGARLPGRRRAISARSGSAWSATERQDVMHFAEFGVVMMLFLVGLELRPGAAVAAARADPRPRRPAGGADRARRWRRSRWRSGSTAPVALAVGLILAMSSTAIVLQTLEREGPAEDRRRPERVRGAAVPGHRGDPDPRPAAAARAPARPRSPARPRPPPRRWTGACSGLGCRRWSCSARSRRSSSPGASWSGRRSASIARTRLREMFTAAALLLVVGDRAADDAGRAVSPALGTFLAGVVLANSEYRHELEPTSSRSRGCCWACSSSRSARRSTSACSPRGRRRSRRSCSAADGPQARSCCSAWAAASGWPRPTTPAVRGRAGPGRASSPSCCSRSPGRAACFPSEVTGPLVAVVALTMAASPLLVALGENGDRPAPAAGPRRDARARRDPRGEPGDRRRLRPLRADRRRACCAPTASGPRCSRSTPTRSTCCGASGCRLLRRRVAPRPAARGGGREGPAAGPGGRRPGEAARDRARRPPALPAAPHPGARRRTGWTPTS